MPTPAPFHLRYELTRRQRLRQHRRTWGVAWTLYILALEAFFLWITFNDFGVYRWTGVFAGLLFAGGLFVLYADLFGGLLDILLVRRRVVDMIIDNETAAILIGAERWHLFLDGITAIRQDHADTWTIEHSNGTVLHIPAAEITDDQLAHLRAAMARGRTPEGFRAVIERGRRIQQLLRRPVRQAHTRQ